MAVLELLAGSPDERFTLSEVARRCELNKATAHALLSALSARGVLLRHPEEKRYSLGPRLVAIGEAARRGYTAIDFVPSALAGLAAATGLWARAWRVVADDVVCVAQVGAPASVDAGAPVRLPLVPPIGALFMAWSDPPTVEAWLARAAAVEVVRPALDALPAIACLGFGVTLVSPEWRALSQPTVGGAGSEQADSRQANGGRGTGEQANGGRGTGGQANGGTGRSAQRPLLLAISRQPLLVGDLDDRAAYRPADVSAPVFGAGGDVDLALSVTVPGEVDMSGAEVRALGARVAAAADDLTLAARGRRPGRPAT